MNKLKIRSGYVYIDGTKLTTVMFCEIQRLNSCTIKATMKINTNKDLPRDERNFLPKLKISDINDKVFIELDDCKLENIIDYKLTNKEYPDSELVISMYVDEVQVDEVF